MDDDRAPEASLPETGRIPLQPPEAVQLVTFVPFQLNMVLRPVITLMDDAVSVSAGAGATVTVTLCETLPPAPLHTMVKTVFAVSAAEDSDPETGFAPFQPFAAEQVVALVLCQVRVVDAPLGGATGLAEMVTVGADAPGATGAESSPPPQEARNNTGTTDNDGYRETRLDGITRELTLLRALWNPAGAAAVMLA